MHNHFPSLRRSLAGSVSLIALAFWSQACFANPVDGVVEAGTADITTPSPGTLVVNQTSQKAIINWGSFDIGTGELTQFVLPGSTSVTLNRDFSGNPSEILGSLKSNGHVYLINPSGILFGTGSTVDVAGLVATTHNIRSDDFLTGKLDFNIAGDPSASVINKGNVTIDDMGIAAFVAPHVRNDGAIVAQMGKVELASANGFTLDLYGDRLVSFLIENPNTLSFGTDGQAVSALVENGGSIVADGGQVVLTAAAARGVVDSVINTDGVIQANSVAQRGGKIILGGGSAGTVRVSGKVTARGNKAGEKGGEIIVTGAVLTADQNAILDASGWAGGGKLLFGGDYLGGNASDDQVARFHFSMEDKPIQRASIAILQEGAKLAADALVDGNGGKVVVWSDEATITAADISARGGSVSGNGGFIETSGGYLQVEKAADASAANGTEGTWLLDPLDITIDRSGTNNLWTYNPSEFFSLYQGGSFNAISARPSSTGSVLSANLIETALNSGSNVVVTTYGTVGSAAGNIRLKADITKTSGGSNRFTLLANNNITVDPGVDVRSLAGSLIFEINAAFGSVFASNVGQIALNGGTLQLIGRNGIQFSSQFDMPDYLAVLLNNTGIGSSPRQVDVSFGQDKIKFNYSATSLDLFSGAIALLDSSATGSLLVGFAQSVNAHLYDRSIVTNANRSWEIGPTVSASAAASSALNGIPEIEGFQNPYWNFGAEPGSGYTPVLEVSALRDGTADRGMHIVTAPSGYAALAAYLSNSQPQLPVLQVVNQALKPTIITAPAAQKLVTPTQKVLAKEILDAFGGDLRAIQAVADNANYAVLAAAAYGDISNAEQLGWKKITFDLNIDNGALVGATVFSLFRDANGNYVVAFRGSATGGDWITNAASLVGYTTEQILAAQTIAKSVVSAFPNASITFVGHSLGGRLAQIAAVSTGNRAVTFNSAPLTTSELVAKGILSVVKPGSSTIGFRSADDRASLLSSSRDIEVKNHVQIDTSAPLYASILGPLQVLLWKAAQQPTKAIYDHSMQNLALEMTTVKITEPWIKSYLAK